MQNFRGAFVPRKPATSFFDDRAVARVAVALLILICLTTAGCTATVEKPPRTADHKLSRCERLYATLDSAVIAAGVQDGGSARVRGFPYLRVDRFLASYRSQPMNRDETAWWVQRMAALDEGARAIEAREPAGRLQDTSSVRIEGIRGCNGPAGSMCEFAGGA